MAEARRFAEGTSVPVEKTKAELERLLQKHGATEIGSHWSEKGSVFIYRLRGRMVRHIVEAPKAEDYSRHPKNRFRRLTPAEAQKHVEAEWRRRWRAQLLIVRAKLEMVASGGSTIEREFLADTLLPTGETVAEAVLPRIAEAYENGEMPKLLLGSGS